MEKISNINQSSLEIENKIVSIGDTENSIKKWVISTLYDHVLPTDPRRYDQANLKLLRTRNWLLSELKEKNNLLYEWKNWGVSTVIWPYGNHHIMLIYTWVSQEISHIGQIPDNQREEYYNILSKIINWLKDEYNIEIASWDSELLYWMNCSIEPWAWKSQSVYRPHTQIVCIDCKEKEEWLHVVKKKSLMEWVKNNKWMLALNQENLALIKEFETNFLYVWIQKYKESFFVTQDEYYAVDFELPWNMNDSETINIFENIHDEWRSFLEEIYNSNTRLISKELLELIWDRKDKLWFSIWFFQEKWIWHLRFRFSFKNDNENAWVLEAMWHSITRNTDAPDNLPNMSRIRKCIKNIL